MQSSNYKHSIYISKRKNITCTYSEVLPVFFSISALMIETLFWIVFLHFFAGDNGALEALDTLRSECGTGSGAVGGRRMFGVMRGTGCCGEK